jgi:hypothetical protein
MKRKLLAGAAAVLVSAGVLLSASPAFATTQYPEGGTWNYGKSYYSNGVQILYSEYYHPSNWHRSSIVPDDGRVYRSGDKAAGIWASVSKESYGANDSCYYFKYSY